MSLGHDKESSIHADPIEFIVRFIYEDLEQFREGDWLNLQDDLAAFERCGPPSLELGPTDENLAKLRTTSDPKLFRKLQVKLASLLQTIAMRQSTTTVSQAPSSKASDPGSVFAFYRTLSSVSFSADVVRIGIADGPDKVPRVLLEGKYFDVLYAKAALVLLLVGSPARERLRLCPECLTVFVRVRRQRYCSRRCVNRANMRGWLGRHKGKASHRASSKRSYAKKVRARLHEKVQIRTRKAKE